MIRVFVSQIRPHGSSEPEESPLLLSADERLRANRYVYPVDRQRFIRARSLLRQILATEAEVAPMEIEFAYGPHGKPWLGGPSAAREHDLRFSLSHSQDAVAIALARGFEVGIDLEAVRPLPDCDQLARSVLSSAELHAFEALPAERRTTAFFHAWTRKEAFLKVTGEGLSRPANTVETGLMPDQPALISSRGALPRCHPECRVESITIAAGYAAAIAYEGARTTVEVISVQARHLDPMLSSSLPRM